MLPLAGEKGDVRVALPMEDANGHDSDYGYFDPEDGVPRTTDGRPSSVPQPFLPLKLGPNLRNYSNSETSPLGSPADMSPLSMLTHAGGESGGIPGFLGAPGAGVQTSMSTLEMALSRYNDLDTVLDLFSRSFVSSYTTPTRVVIVLCVVAYADGADCCLRSNVCRDRCTLSGPRPAW